ncbi:hypothetical protein [Paenibacillus sp. sgz500958]|uniref:hypothetical protein n=1 Tax=Paenibacillus sp. sgz500958 TaxID=3242475 RepID=UPI0036D3CE9A
MLIINDSLILLLILRYRATYKSAPFIDNLIIFASHSLQLELDEIALMEILNSLQERKHIVVQDKKINVSMSFIYYYTEILQPGDNSLETREFIERRKIQFENQENYKYREEF